MSTVKSRSLLSALLCASALFAFACGDRERLVQDEEAAEPEAATQEIPSNELRPEPQSVDVQEEAANDDAEAARAAEVEQRERDLRAREAELAARERVLREQERREQQARARRPRPAEDPRPAPEPREEAPAPAEAPAAEAEKVEPEPVPEPEPEPEEEVEVEVREEPRATPVDLPAGTTFDVEFLDTIGSATSRAGDTFRVRVYRDVFLDGDMVIPGSAEVVGVVTEAAPLGRVGGRAKLGLRFTDLVLPSGSTVPIDASLVQEGRNETGRDAATIGGGAAAGAVLGRILNKRDRGKGSVIGAIIGAAAGAVIASKTAGEEVTIPEGAVVSLKLDGPAEIRPRG
ncbi:MAG TPA: glycine zipper domain-containing protein [Thermoanaerobaculia bacterium]|nr:glycine zipper domain-containing protein [Thermoanaerobaculia bacterium]